MNKRFRCVIAGWLLLMLCACTGGMDEPHIRYYRLASGQSENYLANQACQRFCDMVRRKRTARYKFCRALITSLVPMHPHLSSACTVALILYARQSRLPQRMHPQLAALQPPQ